MLLVNGSISLIRKQWDAVMSLLGILHRLSGVPPGALMGSGATFGMTEPTIFHAHRLERTMGSVKTPECCLQSDPRPHPILCSQRLSELSPELAVSLPDFCAWRIIFVESAFKVDAPQAVHSVCAEPGQLGELI